MISSAWVSQLGFSEIEVGRVAGADLGGLSLGAIFTAIVIARVNRRYLVVGAVVIAVAANGLCMFLVGYDEVLWLRLLAGVGSGIYTAVAVASLGATAKPARAFNMLLFAFAFSQALELHILPQLSMNGIYMVFIGLFLTGLLFLNWVPPRPVTRLVSASAPSSGTGSAAFEAGSCRGGVAGAVAQPARASSVAANSAATGSDLRVVYMSAPARACYVAASA